MITRKDAAAEEHALEFDDRIHHLDQGYWLEFELKRPTATWEQPHGLRYSFTLHAPDGTRLIGFDNAHAVPARGSRYRRSPTEHDHWHRTADDDGRPYQFTSIVQLLADFESKVTRVLDSLGVRETVTRESYSAGRRATMKVQPMHDLISQMRAVARGEIKAPADAAEPSVESAEALLRLLTPDNRSLLRTIRDAKPQSIAELARLTHRAEPNLIRTLGKLEAFGLLEMRTVNRRRVPMTTVSMLAR